MGLELSKPLSRLLDSQAIQVMLDGAQSGVDVFCLAHLWQRD